ncbi:MarR family transcriptional regulator, partial [Clostridium perfringens]
GINQGGLADLLEVEPITLCRMIDRLEEAGLVERRRDPADRRAWQIFLTERARPLLEELGHLAEAMLDSALQGVSPAEYD